MRNRYCRSSKLSEAKFRELVKYFAADLTAVQIAQLSGINRNTVNRYLRLIRDRIVAYCEAQRPMFGVVEVDESSSVPVGSRVSVAGGRMARPWCSGSTSGTACLYRDRPQWLQSHVAGHHPRPGRRRERHQLGWLARLRRPGRHRLWTLPVDHGKDEFANGPSHINGIEGFWGCAKVRLAKFRGMHPETFFLHLKETEFRFNHRQQKIGRLILKLCRLDPLN